MWNFCEPWTKRLNLTLKETIMTALDRPGESPPNFFFKKAPWTKQILFFLMEWASYVAEKNEGILFPKEIRVVHSYTDRLLNCKKPQTNMLKNTGSMDLSYEKFTK